MYRTLDAQLISKQGGKNINKITQMSLVVLGDNTNMKTVNYKCSKLYNLVKGKNCLI